ncbi:peptide chain release factor 3 [Alicyclobacillus fastidiosus]|uniref:Peptide chain release factor 3 n=1 Tax=Alicyclobacillus fastidiosus TaxID=392011 RepID=A0ABY6ZE46_9BACL|nr:peptide chain release factor 3 [Alicyclobacillus fastidiosus]WAH41160.1 peptide chain release factor 3 [Alicyclobacillus fastidiosus]GMA62731.1 peptide chain release factor 3 [Alicyclobacillus fastidiosus]
MPVESTKQQGTQIERRTFAIISHPDAGKTTLTEKLLLFGGAIREAGAVKGKKARRHATSDWMEIEKQRGISVTSTVLQFSYRNRRINILDTPGHEDFSEDTYRTLTAADSAVMLIDAAKGVEPQTIKLFEVCRMRGIPIFTFINKLDRQGKDPLALLEEIEEVLGIRSCPMNWPIGMGQEFQGIYNRADCRFERFTERGEETEDIQVEDIDHPSLREVLGPDLHDQLKDEVMLLDIAGDPFDEELVGRGQLTPVFFGSAIANFGVETFLNQFIDLAPAPGPRQTDAGVIEPTNPSFSGFVFKIQANMNPAHRDRVAFIRICSGKFERGMNVLHVRTGKKANLAQPQQFFGQGREIIDEAYPGDIIGIFDPGLFRIGDTLTESGRFHFEKLPQFSPEHFARVYVKNTLKYKQFHKGIEQLSEEGAIQVFRQANRTEDMVLGAVGQLQFEVFQYRMKSEYGTDVELYNLPYSFARWIESSDDIEKLNYDRHSIIVVKDKDDRLVMLFPNEFSIRLVLDKNPGVVLHSTSYGM